MNDEGPAPWQGWSMEGWWWPEEIQATVEDNPVVATLYAPNGAVLLELRERTEVPFGFQARA